MSRGSIDSALVWLIDLFLSLPQLPVLLLMIYLFRDCTDEPARAADRHLHPDRRGDRRASAG